MYETWEELCLLLLAFVLIFLICLDGEGAWYLGLCRLVEEFLFFRLESFVSVMIEIFRWIFIQFLVLRLRLQNSFLETLNMDFTCNCQLISNNLELLSETFMCRVNLEELIK